MNITRIVHDLYQQHKKHAEHPCKTELEYVAKHKAQIYYQILEIDCNET